MIPIILITMLLLHVSYHIIIIIWITIYELNLRLRNDVALQAVITSISTRMVRADILLNQLAMLIVDHSEFCILVYEVLLSLHFSFELRLTATTTVHTATTAVHTNRCHSQVLRWRWRLPRLIVVRFLSILSCMLKGKFFIWVNSIHLCHLLLFLHVFQTTFYEYLLISKIKLIIIVFCILFKN